MDVRVPVLEDCIREGSNRPYWEQPRLYSVQEDLRNPKLKAEREAVFNQFGLNAADYVRDESAAGKENVPAPTDTPTQKSFFNIFKKK